MSIAFLFAIGLFGRAEQAGIAAPDYGLTSEVRLSLWKDALGVFLDHPVIGTGLDTFKEVHGAYSSINTTFYEAKYVHNDYLQMLSDSGILGLASMLLLLFFSGKALLKAFMGRKSEFSRALGGGAALGCLSYLIHSFFDFNLRITSNLFLFAFLLSIAYSVLNSRDRNPGETENKKTEMPENYRKGVVYSSIAFISFSLLGIWMILSPVSVSLRKSASVTQGEVFEKRLSLASRINPLDADNYAALAQYYARKKDFKYAERLIEKAKRLRPFDPYVHYEAFNIYRAEKDIDKAKSSLEEALRKDRMNAKWFMVAGDFYIENDHIERSVKNYRRAIELAPNYARGIISKYFARSGDPLLARSLVPQDDKEILSWLFSEMVMKGMHQEAAERFLEEIPAKKENLLFYEDFTRTLLRKEQYSLVVKVLQNSLVFNDSMIYRNLGISLLKVGKIEEGILNLKRSFEIDPGNTQSLDDLYDFLDRNKNLDLCKQALDELKKKFESKAHIHYLYSKFYNSKGDWLKALEEARSSISKDILNPRYRYNLGSLYFGRGLYVDAIEEWKKIIELNDKEVWIKHYIANAFEKMGNLEKAKMWRN